MTQYSLGKASVTNGTAAVVGVGTAWSTALAAGQYFAFLNENVWYVIETITDDTHLTLTSNYTGVTKAAQNYLVQLTYTPNNNYPLPTFGDQNVSSLLSVTLLELDTKLASFSPLVAAMQGAVTLNGACTLTLSGGTSFQLQSLTKATAPAPTMTANEPGSPGAMIYVIDTTGGPSICVSTGTAWKMLLLTATMA